MLILVLLVLRAPDWLFFARLVLLIGRFFEIFEYLHEFLRLPIQFILDHPHLQSAHLVQYRPLVNFVTNSEKNWIQEILVKVFGSLTPLQMHSGLPTLRILFEHLPQHFPRLHLCFLTKFVCDNWSSLLGEDSQEYDDD